MYICALYNTKKWQVLLWPRLCVYEHGYMPRDGKCKGLVLQYWLTPLIEIRKFHGE